jgi:hypothetical protein
MPGSLPYLIHIEISVMSTSAIASSFNQVDSIPSSNADYIPLVGSPATNRFTKNLPSDEAFAYLPAATSTMTDVNDIARHEAILRLAATNPEAVLLTLDERAGKARKEAQAMRDELGVLVADGSLSERYIDDFEEVLAKRDGDTNADGDVVAEYIKYYNALNALLVKIQAFAGFDMDGTNKVRLAGPEILEEVVSFMNRWANEKLAGPLSWPDAVKLQKRFKAGTVEIIYPEDGWCYIAPGFKSVGELGQTICSDGGGADDFVRYVNRWVEHPQSWNEFSKSKEYDALRKHLAYSVYPSQLQAYNLTLDDIRKTHSTDLQFATEYYSRSVTQFDSFLKLYSTLIQSLAETAKGFL